MVVKTETLEEKARELLKERGVTVEDIAQLVMFLQKDYISDLTLADCTESVNSVLDLSFINRECLRYDWLYELWLYR